MQLFIAMMQEECLRAWWWAWPWWGECHRQFVGKRAIVWVLPNTRLPAHATWQISSMRYLQKDCL